jgi:gluconolactonase
VILIDLQRIAPEQRIFSSEACALRRDAEPYFAVHGESFIDILGSQPRIELVLKRDYPFAHEAGVYLPEQDAIYVTSNLFKPAPASEPTIWVSKIQRQNDGLWTCEKLDTAITMGNGAINYESEILFCDQGSKNCPGGLVLMSPTPPYKTKTLIDSFHGRSFNSVNDVVVHTDGSIWFVSIGHISGNRQSVANHNNFST